MNKKLIENKLLVKNLLIGLGLTILIVTCFFYISYMLYSNRGLYKQEKGTNSLIRHEEKVSKELDLINKYSHHDNRGVFDQIVKSFVGSTKIIEYNAPEFKSSTSITVVYHKIILEGDYDIIVRQLDDLENKLEFLFITNIELTLKNINKFNYHKINKIKKDERIFAEISLIHYYL